MTPIKARLRQDPVFAFPWEWGRNTPPAQVFLSELMNHAGNWAHMPSSWQLLPSPEVFLMQGSGRAKMRKWLRATRHLGVWRVSISGPRIQGSSDAVQLAKSIYLRGFTTHGSATFFGHKWWPSWWPVLTTNVEKLPPEPRRHHTGRQGLAVLQYNCESLRSSLWVNGLDDADVAYLQGTLFVGVDEWTKQGTISSHSFVVDHVTQGTCISSVRTRRYTMREHKHSYLKLFEMISSEN